MFQTYKHFSTVFHNFFLIHVICWIFENNCPGGGVLARFFCLRVWGFALSLCPRGGDSPFTKKKFARGLPGGGGGGGGWSGLELTDTLSLLSIEYLY